MSDIAICVENLGKLYRIGQRERYYTLRDTLSRSAGGLRSWVLGLGSSVFGLDSLAPNTQHLTPDTESLTPNTNHIWALKDVSFEVKRGEIVGIIGRNGAGKTTLLKVLSRITKPTEGYAEVHGRVGSLLEVGTGFHPELSGRENIYLNGAILGMKKSEIERKFDEIVSFAEIEKFLDTPVKHYSSGMYMRLAFAVAAHLEPEILLVDEVLAVGDAAFQKKCLGKMGDVAKEGRTVLFVSHNMAAVQSLCETGCLLTGGRIGYWGHFHNAVHIYLQSQISLSEIPLRERRDRRGTGRVRATAISITTSPGGNSCYIRSGDSLKIKIDYESAHSLTRARFLVGIYDHMDLPLFRLDSEVTRELPDLLPNNGTVVCDTGPLNVTPGPGYMNIAVLVGGEIADHVTKALDFNIEPSDFYSTGRLFERRDSLFLLSQQWHTNEAKT